MKLSEIHNHETQDQLDEKALRKAAAAAALAGTLAMPSASISGDKIEQPPEPAKVSQKAEKPKDEISVIAKRMRLAWPEIDIPAPTLVKRVELARKIAKEYRVDVELVQQIVDLAYKYEDKDFPKAKDILAVIGIESSFNPDSKSALRHDPAVGLMQVRPGIWDLKPEDLATIEGQIKSGVDILKKYYRKTGSAEDALHAYNMGITNFRRGLRNDRYVNKYKNFVAANF